MKLKLCLTKNLQTFVSASLITSSSFIWIRQNLKFILFGRKKAKKTFLKHNVIYTGVAEYLDVKQLATRGLRKNNIKLHFFISKIKF